ncbi:MAG TPA: amidohydrolase [Vicinamibacterales bacterium]|jgi:aminobenzoyl-glutamate utilization protein B
MRASRVLLMMLLIIGLSGVLFAAPPQKPVKGKASVVAPVDARLEVLKRDLATEIDGLKDLTQQMVDSIFSFGEVGFQEFETKKYCAGILKSNGFAVDENVAGMPTGWTARWGSGKPVIALGSDVDGLLGTSQKPGIPRHEPFIEGAPGHGEGHNTGIPLSITAALALKKVMEREKIPGTIVVWPGIAEELVGGKAQYVKAGVFKDVDICLFSHISSNFGVSWGDSSGTGLVSVEYSFTGQSAHAGGAPWQGRSALDAVELMDVGWNFRREHLRLSQRSHYVITDGGGQPNVVPPTASVWYYFREIDYPHIKDMWSLGNTMAEGAAMMTGTTVTSRLLGSAWPQHMNKTVAETMYANIQKVGMPPWSEADQAFAKIVQRAMKVKDQGLLKEVGKLEGPVKLEDNRGGGSDDIGDVSWTVPTVTLRYPGNIPGMTGHHWSSAIAEATPVAHKGVTTGAKVEAMTAMDLLVKPELVQQAWEYFKNVQSKDVKYQPFPGEKDKPATWLNEKLMMQLRPEMRKFYYEPGKYKTYLEQLGIAYPPAETKQ